MKKIVCIVAILVSQFSFSQENEIPERKQQRAFAQIDFMSINMPETTILNEPNMGFMGIHYNLKLNDWSYAGVGLYGSISGRRGGFFTLGANAGIKKYVSEKLFFDLGFHIGAGGGAAAPDGGGIFILPHANLGVDFKHFSLTSGWSYVNFFDGGLIRNHQLNVALQIPMSFDYSKNSAKEKEFSTEQLRSTKWNSKTRKTTLAFHLNNLRITGRSENSSGVPYNGETIRLAGFEMNSFLNKNWFLLLKVDGAYDGIDAGFMDVFLGGGYEFSFNQNNTRILAKFAVGAGGGGGVETEGGVLLQPDISIEQRLFGDLFLSINRGAVFSPNSNFTSTSYGAGLKYELHRNGLFNDVKKFTTGKFKGFEVFLGHDLYLNAKRITNPTEDMHQISLQMNLELNKNVYVAAQTSFASFGDAGAYGEGLIGLGVQTSPFYKNKLSLFAQILGGAAGGGNISTGQGLIAKPSIGIDFKIRETLSLRTSAGYVQAIDGELSSPFMNFGLKYNFSFLKTK